MNLTRGINLKKIAEAMPGASGAEIKVSVMYICLPIYWVTFLLLIYSLLYFVGVFWMFIYFFIHVLRNIFYDIVSKQAWHYILFLLMHQQTLFCSLSYLPEYKIPFIF